MTAAPSQENASLEADLSPILMGEAGDAPTEDGLKDCCHLVVSAEAPAPNRLLFADLECDADTALQYNRPRYYDPRTGRWSSRDPIAFCPGNENLFPYPR